MYRRLPGVHVDASIAVALVVYAQIAVWVQHGVVPGSKLLAAVGLALVTAPLAARRCWPLGVTAITMGALAIESLAAGGAPEGAVVLLPVLIVLYSLGAHEPLSRALAGAAIALVAVVIQSIQDPKIAGIGDVVLVDGFFFGLIGGAAWLVGRYARRRRGIESTLHDRAASLERERAEQAAVLAAERSRIARELHDVVAHTVCVMGIQAAAAAEVLDRDPEKARAPARVDPSDRARCGRRAQAAPRGPAPGPRRARARAAARPERARGARRRQPGLRPNRRLDDRG